MKIITDTNVWYALGKKSFKIINYDNCKLVVPITVLYELILSPNLWKNQSSFDHCQYAIKTILDYKHLIDIVKKDPIKYITSKISLNVHEKEISSYWSDLEFLSNCKFADMKKMQIQHLRTIPQNTTNYFNHQSRKYNNIIKKIGKSRFNKSPTILFSLDLINSIVIHYAKKNNILLNRKLKLSDSYLFINVFDLFLRELSISHRKIKNNDWIDMFNLVYVEKDMKYWSKETKWNKFIENIDKNYIFEKYNCTNSI